MSTKYAPPNKELERASFICAHGHAVDKMANIRIRKKLCLSVFAVNGFKKVNFMLLIYDVEHACQELKLHSLPEALYIYIIYIYICIVFFFMGATISIKKHNN